MDAEFKRKAKIIATEKMRNYIVKAIDEAENAKIIAIEGKKSEVVFKLKIIINNLFAALREIF